MQINTLDGLMIINNFEQFQAVVEKAEGVEDIRRKDSNKVTYNGHSINIQPGARRTLTNIRSNLEKQIPNVLNDMEVWSYCGDCDDKNGVFREKLNFILVWLRSIRVAAGQVAAQTNVTQSQIEIAIEWVYFVMKKCRPEFSECDFVCAENIINNL
jgi:hypothetical protein